MDTAFFKCLAGERPVTPPPLPPVADPQAADSPISRFRKELPPTVVDRLAKAADDKDRNGPHDEEGLGALLMMRSFGSFAEDNVDEAQVQQAREAISSASLTTSRLSDTRIHEILLAAMHYQREHSHTLPSSSSRPNGLLSPLSFDSGRILRNVTSKDATSLLQDSRTEEDEDGEAEEKDTEEVDEIEFEWHESSNGLDLMSSSSSASTNSIHTNSYHGSAVHSPLPQPTTSSMLIQEATYGESRQVESPEKNSTTGENVFRGPEEKKESEAERSVHLQTTTLEDREPSYVDLMKSLSMTESDVGSVEGLPRNLRSTWQEGREKVLEKLDGVPAAPTWAASQSPPRTPPHEAFVLIQEERQENSTSIFDSLACWFGGPSLSKEDADGVRQKPQPTTKHTWKEEAEDTLALLGCAPLIPHHYEEPAPAVANSLVRVTDEPLLPSFAETIREMDVDYRLPSWVEGLRNPPEASPYDGSFGLGKSKTVIIHEICRGDWTWCTAWSPKGDRLAVASQNHHLAIIETMSSAVWRVRHDRRLTGPAKNHTTHSVRSIAWGRRFIAAGGTGDAVSIISSIEPYPILHTVEATGFVGSLHWKPDSDILAIGSRLRKLLIVKVEATDNGKQTDAEVLYSLNYTNWVNRVAFSPGGTCLAVGIATGELFVYNFCEKPDEVVELNEMNKFQMDDSILDISWSPDGKWLYAGGEDFHVTIIDTRYWQVVHRIDRDRWVQCIASSHGGTHVAVGGVNAEISIMDVANGWDSVMGIELKGLVPLSAQWHPKDQAVALTGQSDSILVVETTNARHVRGHHLRSVSPVLAIEFSPDGRLVLIGNEDGVVTLFSLSKSSFEVVYELAVTLNDRLSTCWSRNGVFAVVGSKDALLILGRRHRESYSPDQRHAVGTEGYSIQKVIRSIGATNTVSIDYSSKYVAIGGDKGVVVLNSTADFVPVIEWTTGATIAVEFSPDRQFLAAMGDKNTLTIYDTRDSRPTYWRAIFSLKCDFCGRALSWSPQNVGGLQYLAYGGKSNHIYITEIRIVEHTWETVLRIPRDEHVCDLDWSASGLLAAGSENGTVTIIDLAYLQCGIPANEKDYQWQRQALTCFTQIRRNRGNNTIRAVRWIPSAPGSDSLLAVGGTDGEVEIIDLTERKNCQGYARKKKR